MGGPYPKLNWLKAGILSSDKLLTVSPNYAAEIARDESSGVVSGALFGPGLMGAAAVHAHASAARCVVGVESVEHVFR
jgi:hypothetical protein